MFVFFFIILLCVQTSQSIGSCECGLSNGPKLATRIPHGKVAPDGKYPWMISIGHCGGTFITNTHILTAAHCGLYFEGKKIHFGSNDKDKFTGEATIATVNRNPKYNVYTHDIDKFVWVFDLPFCFISSFCVLADVVRSLEVVFPECFE